MVGSTIRRRTFLWNKVNKETTKICKLQSLLAQHVLFFFSRKCLKCLAQDLRTTCDGHCSRHCSPDNAVWGEFLRLRLAKCVRCYCPILKPEDAPSLLCLPFMEGWGYCHTMSSLSSPERQQMKLPTKS